MGDPVGVYARTSEILSIVGDEEGSHEDEDEITFDFDGERERDRWQE